MSNDDPDNLVELKVVKDCLVLRQFWEIKKIIREPKTSTYFYNEGESYPVVLRKSKGVEPGEDIWGREYFAR